MKKLIVLVFATVLFTGCASIKQTADFLRSNCSYDKQEEQVILTCSGEV